MKKADTIVQLLLPDILGKTILEAACGRADFSIAASGFANEVYCMDIVDFRLDDRTARENIHFERMDATAMRYPDETFDSVFLYNAFMHIEDQWEAIEKECMRVLKKNGKLFVIGSWKLDTARMEPKFADKAKWNGEFLIVELPKN